VIVVLVTSPGVAFDAYRPLYTALRDRGAAVTVVEPGCVGGLDALAARVRAVVDASDRPVVVAHGLGATIALDAGGDVERYVLLAPVLGMPPSASLVADDLPVGCFSAALAREIEGWRVSGVPLALDRVDAPVWIGIGLLDEVAPTEIIVPRSRGLAHRTVVRLGITAFDPADYHHAALLTDPVPVRAAAIAAVPR